VPPPLEVGAGGVDEQGCLALGDSDRAQVDPASHIDGGPGIAKGHGDVHAVQPGVRGAEGGPTQVTVHAEPLGCAVGFVEQLVRGGALIVLGGGDRAAQQEGPIHRQRRGGVGRHCPVQPLGVASGGGDGRRFMLGRPITRSFRPACIR